MHRFGSTVEEGMDRLVRCRELLTVQFALESLQDDMDLAPDGYVFDKTDRAGLGCRWRGSCLI